MQDRYPLEYIDLLANTTLNPNSGKLQLITSEEVETIKTYLSNETHRIQLSITSQIFATNKKKAVELLIRQYYSSTIHIIDLLVSNNDKIPNDNMQLLELYESMLTVLNDLLMFIENRFAKFLSLEEKVATTYLDMTKMKLSQRLVVLGKRFNVKEYNNNTSLQLLLSRLERFTRQAGSGFEVTLGTLFYKKELVEGLEELEIENVGSSNDSVFNKIDKLLIYLNYNSKTYIDELTLRIFQSVNTLKTALQKLNKLRYYRKQFKQLHRKPGFVLNPNYHDLDVIIESWFDEEIYYFEKLVQVSPPVVLPRRVIEESEVSKEEPERSKILCSLTTDQIALILRGADEARIFIAKSLSEVFKTIAPHLSTLNKSDLSADSMRTKAYVGEERDKEITIAALEKVIKKIKGY